MKDYHFQTWLERREPNPDEIKDALIGAIPEKIKSAAGVTGANPKDKSILLGKPISAFSKSKGIVNAILQQGAIKNVLNPDMIDQINQAVKNDEGGTMTFQDLLGMILGQSPQGEDMPPPEETPPAPTGSPPAGQMPPQPPPQLPADPMLQNQGTPTGVAI